MIVPIIEPFPSKKLILGISETSKFGLLKRNLFEKPQANQEKDKSTSPPTLTDLATKLDTTLSSQQFIISLILQQNQKLAMQVDTLKKEIQCLS